MSAYSNCKSTVPIGSISIIDFLHEIRDEVYGDEIKKLRSIADKKQRDAYKSSTLKTVTYAGIFQERKNDLLTVYSGVIILDIDNVADSEIERIKADLSNDKYALAVWSSPSGTGIKVMVKMDFGFSADTYKAKYLCVLNYYSTTHNIPTNDSRKRNAEVSWGFDLSCSDIARQCIYSADKDVYINEDSIVFDAFDSFSATEQKVISILKHIRETALDITETYHDWFNIACALHHEFGEAARSYFHAIGCYYPNYTEQETDKLFDSVIKSGSKGITIATLFHIAKEHGIGIPTAKAQHSGTNKNEAGIDVHTPDEKEFNISYAPFPVDAFPSEAKDYMLEVQQSLKCPIDFIGVAVLAAISAAIGSTRIIKTRNGHIEAANLFLALVAEPGSKKSPAIRKANVVIEWLQGKAKDEYDRHYAVYKEEMTIWEKSKKSERGPAPIEPHMKQYFVSDFTMEVLTKILSLNERGVLLISDELATWFNTMDAYRKKSGDRQKWLSLWSGEAIKVDRKSDLPIFIKNPFVSVIGGIQPEIIRDFNKRNRRDGFMDRLLFTYPDRILAYSDTAVSQLVKDNYVCLIKELYALEPLYKHNDDSDSEADKISVPVLLDNEANQLWREWNLELIEELNNPFFPYYLEGAWSKLIGHTLRFALIFHCLNSRKHGLYTKVTAEDMRSAFELAKYFKYQIFKVMGYCNDDDADVNVAEVYSRAKKSGGTITAREVYKNKIGKCKNAQDVEALFKEMEKRNLGKTGKRVPPSGGKETVFFTISEIRT